jgi:homoserine kinase
MGPGFDTLGMALDMWNELTATRAPDGKLKIEIEGQGAGQIPLDDTNLVVIGAKAAFKAAGAEYTPLHFKCKNRIPFGRGLGSSSAAIVSGIMAGLALCGHELKVYGENSMYRGGAAIEPEELLQIASDIEGHPDNVCPCIYGGIQLGILLEATAEKKRHWRSCRVNCPTDMQLVAFISDTVGKTSELRAVLPEKLEYKQAVFNIGRVAFLVNALNSNKLYDLRFGTQDALHQPQRGAKVYHHLQPLIDAGLKEGAHAVYLSGAGPTVMAITSGAAGDVFAQRSTERTEIKVANAMVQTAKEKGHPGQVYITRPVQHGAYISKADPPFSTGLLQYPGGL